MKRLGTEGRPRGTFPNNSTCTENKAEKTSDKEKKPVPKPTWTVTSRAKQTLGVLPKKCPQPC